MKNFFICMLLTLLGSIMPFFSTYADEKSQILFESPGIDGHPYRIPAITTLKNGNILSVADFRWCDSDIGNGHVDIVGRISSDNGATWGEQFNIAVGSGIKGAHDCGYGDAAIVTDRETGCVLIMCCTGNVFYPNSRRDNPLRSARLYSNDNGVTWTQPEDITDDMYALLPNTKALFIGSGKICQSRVVKVGKYYRLYAALCTLNKNNIFSSHSENYVIYSDDFGHSWHVLGSNTESCAPNGDEPKCEELPDGSVVLSSRKDKGRYFNIFKYSDVRTAQGSWTGVVSSNDVSGGLAFNTNSTNGEIQLLQVVRNNDQTQHYMMLQSVPYGAINSGDEARSNVCIFYKVFDENTMNSADELAVGWTRGMIFEDPKGAYSTMCIQPDYKLGFLYETSPGEFSLVYRPIAIEELTGEEYCMYNPDIHGDWILDHAEFEAAKKRAEEVLEEYADRHASKPALGQYPSSLYNNLQKLYVHATIKNYKKLDEAIALLKGSCNWPVFVINSLDPDKGIGKSLSDNGSNGLNISGTDNNNTWMQWVFEGLSSESMTPGTYTVTNVATGGLFWGAGKVGIENTQPAENGQFVIRTNETDNPVYHKIDRFQIGDWVISENEKITTSDNYAPTSGAAWSFTYIGESYNLGRTDAVANFQDALSRATVYEGKLGTTTGTFNDPDHVLEQALKEAHAKDIDQFETYELVLLTYRLNDGLNALFLNMPEAGKFYRFRSKNTKKYIACNNTPGERLKMVDQANDASTVFFLSADGHLTESNLRQLYSSWTAEEYGTCSQYTFIEASEPGCYIIQPDALSYLYDNSDANGTLDNWEKLSTSNGYCIWEIIEVTDPEMQPKLTKTMTAEYGTIAAPVTLNIPEGIKAYTVTVDESQEEAILEELTEGIIPAETGVVLRRTNQESVFDFTLAAEGYFYGTNNLEPVYHSKEIGKDVNAYILANVNHVIGFYRLDPDNRTLSDFKAYLVLPASLNYIQSFAIDAETTGVDDISLPAENTSRPDREKVYYDLQGRRVAKPTRGIYITNDGKKVFFK